MSESYAPLAIFFILASIALILGIYAYFNVPMFTEIINGAISYFKMGIDKLMSLY